MLRAWDFYELCLAFWRGAGGVVMAQEPVSVAGTKVPKDAASVAHGTDMGVDQPKFPELAVFPVLLENWMKVHGWM